MGNRKRWEIERHRSYVEALGGQHLIRITPYDDPDDPRFAYVDVQLLEHAGWHDGLRLRIRNALRMLRGHYDSTGFSLESAEEAEAVVDALRSASELAFGRGGQVPA